MSCYSKRCRYQGDSGIMRRYSCAEKYMCMHARLALFDLKEYIIIHQRRISTQETAASSTIPLRCRNEAKFVQPSEPHLPPPAPSPPPPPPPPPHQPHVLSSSTHDQCKCLDRPACHTRIPLTRYNVTLFLSPACPPNAHLHSRRDTRIPMILGRAAFAA